MTQHHKTSAAAHRWHGPLLAGAVALLLSACAGMAPPDAAGTAKPADGAATVATAPKPQRRTAQAAVAVTTAPDGSADVADANQPFFPLPMYGDAVPPDAADGASAAQQPSDATPGTTVDGPSIRFSRKRGATDPSQDGDDDDGDNNNNAIPGTEIDRGTASWYGLQFHGRRTANGERYDMYELTAAHKTLPFNTIVRVKSLQTGRTVRVRINDRGPFVQGRVIDLSKAAADELGMVELGVKPVSLTVAEWPDGTLAEEGKAPPRSPKRKRAFAASRR